MPSGFSVYSLHPVDNCTESDGKRLGSSSAAVTQVQFIQLAGTAVQAGPPRAVQPGTRHRSQMAIYEHPHGRRSRQLIGFQINSRRPYFPCSRHSKPTSPPLRSFHASKTPPNRPTGRPAGRGELSAGKRGQRRCN